ncbi:uncharacterized protein LAJ45_05873 [Morchella importuna]|uniref:uncharacterized protein n=1 Tax=Morchella importuna TaxID=1174673 RepID=UPI001E8D49E8|nr:uncharacterized protein LAJ45_05873 [Morchella importuna]KAH8150187.1 hypothetical protein LAJ45_05873 [Morchella importuna]
MDPMSPQALHDLKNTQSRQSWPHSECFDHISGTKANRTLKCKNFVDGPMKSYHSGESTLIDSITVARLSQTLLLNSSGERDNTIWAKSFDMILKLSC